MIDLAPQNPFSLTISSPLIAAAGSLGYGVEYARQLGLGTRPASHGIGAIVTRTTTLHARRARPLPAIYETPAGILSAGMEHNPGLRVLRERFAPVWASWDLPIIVSVAGADAAETAALAGELEGIEGVSAIELPLAAHNALEPDAAKRLVAALRRATLLPLIVKLPGHAPDIVSLARAAIEAGADTLALIDSLPAMTPASDGSLRNGRLSGPAIFPLALRLLSEVRASVETPIIAIGGVQGPIEARSMLAAGASAVGLDTALLSDLRTPARIVQEIHR